ncbi:MAG: HAMP domain-containing sensor histidine kinase [Patescibacteria group bacterium]
MNPKIRHSLFFRFFLILLALGIFPMAIASIFFAATYQSRIRAVLEPRDASALIETISIQFLLIFFFVLIIATFAAIMITRHIARPLSVLTEAVKRIGAGNFKVHISVSRRDEIGVLGSFFNEMAERIQESKDRQEEVSQLKSEFISIAAHQLRTPLSIQKWVYQGIIDGDFGKITKNQREAVEKGTIANESMIRLVHNLLDAARIEEGRFGFKFEPMDIVAFTKKIIDEKMILAKAKNITLTLGRVTDAQIMLNADPDRLSIAIGNIIENAIRYTASGGTVSVRLEADNTFAIIKISDTGIGIAAEDQPRMFTRFYRGSNVMHMETEGTGLGLFITKNIVVAHGGDISFHSEEGKGTTFLIRLPRASSPKSPVNPPAEPFVAAL